LIGQSSQVLSPGGDTQVVRLPDTAVYSVQLYHVGNGTTGHSFTLCGLCDIALLTIAKLIIELRYWGTCLASILSGYWSITDI